MVSVLEHQGHEAKVHYQERKKEKTREPIPAYTLLHSHKAISRTDPEIYILYSSSGQKN